MNVKLNCRKVHYVTKSSARVAALKITDKKGKGRLRVYKCSECRGYHLTSYTAGEIAKMKDRLLNERLENEKKIQE